MNRLILAVLLLAPVAPTVAADLVLVDEGRPRAQIVIADDASRTARLAASELRAYLRKISGAQVPIVTSPRDDLPVRLYVGRSRHTDQLGITAEGLAAGAYRIVSGEDWITFIGDDSEFTPIEPWARGNGDIASGKLQAAWNAITSDEWGVPNGGMYKNRLRLPADLGKPDQPEPADSTPESTPATPKPTAPTAAPKKAGNVEPMTLWAYDERGSFNAVCGFLRDLGVRWYMPGELGEVIPAIKTIRVAPIDRTVRPDFPMRRFNIRFSVVGEETSMWAMRLGVRDPAGIQVAHGLATMTGRDPIFQKHPEWFALYGGKRDYDPASSKNQLCYSNAELFDATVQYARKLFDHYKFDAVSIMPPDGYTAICQCKQCQGKASPERDARGQLSDHVWDFVNRAARELRKTHPDRKVLNCAYGVYTLPPLKIEKLEPNVQVCIVGGRRPRSNRPDEQAYYQKLRQDWAAKTDNPILIFENYPFTDRGWYLPAFTAESIGQSINDTKGVSQGEDIWLSVGRDFATDGIAFNHFLVYFTARMYWGGKQADVAAMLAEYCRLFYGPAESEMLAFFRFCEANWQDMEKEGDKANAALALFDKARAKAAPGSVYASRLGLMDEFLNGLRRKTVQLAQKRGVVPKLRLVGEPREPIVVDGKLDDQAWRDCPVAATGSLRELQTGRQPIFGTSVKAAWTGNNLYFAIRCDERPGEKLNVTATKKDDQAIWYGDVVEILLESETHSYYQIAINPAGAVVDIDRGADKGRWTTWDARAEVATRVADDHWTIEIRFPVTDDENDPLHQVIGRKPTQSLPWHINICRQRVRDSGTEHSAFSPTGTSGFHEPMRFAHFYDGRSHQFEADPTVTDYLTASRAAADLPKEQAIAAFVKLAEGKVTDLQKSRALESAASAARGGKDIAQADALAARIPIEAVRKTVLMQNLLSERKAAEVVAAYGNEDIAAWPFWQAGEGHLARGRAYALLGKGQEAEVDLTRALELISDRRLRTATHLAIGDNRVANLKNDATALAAYQAAIEGRPTVGGADEFAAVQSAARILIRLGKPEDAITILGKANIDKLRGTWRNNLLLSLGDAQHAAGKADDARKSWQAILDDKSSDQRYRTAAEARLKAVPR